MLFKCGYKYLLVLIDEVSMIKGYDKVVCFVVEEFNKLDLLVYEELEV